MKTIFNCKVLVLLMLLVSHGLAIAATRTVTREEVIQLAKSSFANQDVDYYWFIPDTNMGLISGKTWTIFIDAEPNKGWEHMCYTVMVPTTVEEGKLPTAQMNIYRLPPKGTYTPLEVKQRYKASSNVKPKVVASSLSNDAKEAATRTYALIISGGIAPVSNHERYWNDCSFIYQTLVNKYGVPKGNIYPLMADGTDPASDTRLVAGGYKSQSLDLDNDGNDEIELSASKANITSVLNSLNTKLKKDDQLFIYVIDHGGTTDYNTNSYICLWNYEKLYDTELATMLKPFTAKYVNVNVVLGQCFSGGFIDNLEMAGCVVAAASKGSESSWACTNIPYDEFVYHWTCAVNGATHTGAAVSADIYKDGKISMLEAFNYAKENDAQSESPQYSSTPSSIGTDLAFDYVVPAVDLYIKDNDKDTGIEPNLTTDTFWKSPSIWIRNDDDGVFKHENPIYSADHKMAYVYVRVYNRGKQSYTGGQWLHVYWAQASTNMDAKVWRGRETYNNSNVTGGPLEPIAIGPIKPGEYRDIKINWALPTLLEQYPKGNFHFCLLAKIMDTSYDDTYVEGVTKFNLRASNNEAQKNVTIISENELLKDFKVYVRNNLDIQQAYSLELIPRTSADKAFFSKGVVDLGMSKTIYGAWQLGGRAGLGYIVPVSESNSPNSGYTVRLTSSVNKLSNLKMAARQFDIISVKFKFNSVPNENTTYTFDLVQKDMNGNIMGGETFIVESTDHTAVNVAPMMVNQNVNEDGSIILDVDGEEYKQVEWRNSSLDTLSESSEISLAPGQTNSEYIVLGVNKDNELVSNVVNVGEVFGIKSIIFSNISRSIDVTFNNETPSNASIMITSVINPNNFVTTVLNEGELTHHLDISSLKSGVYTLTYMIGEQPMDSEKIIVE